VKYTRWWRGLFMGLQLSACVSAISFASSGFLISFFCVLSFLSLSFLPSGVVSWMSAGALF
jgi:hypothetical protein